MSLDKPKCLMWKSITNVLEFFVTLCNSICSPASHRTVNNDVIYAILIIALHHKRIHFKAMSAMLLP